MTSGGRYVIIRSVTSNVRICSGPMNILAGGPPFPCRVTTLGGCENLSAGRPRGAFTPKIRLDTCDHKVKNLKLPKSLSSRSHFMHITFAGRGSGSSSDRGTDIDRFFRVLNSMSRRENLYRIARNGCRVALCASYYGYSGKVCCCAACSGDRVATMSVGERGLSRGLLVECPIVARKGVY